MANVAVRGFSRLLSDWNAMFYGLRLYVWFTGRYFRSGHVELHYVLQGLAAFAQAAEQPDESTSPQ